MTAPAQAPVTAPAPAPVTTWLKPLTAFLCGWVCLCVRMSLTMQVSSCGEYVTGGDGGVCVRVFGCPLMSGCLNCGVLRWDRPSLPRLLGLCVCVWSSSRNSLCSSASNSPAQALRAPATAPAPVTAGSSSILAHDGFLSTFGVSRPGRPCVSPVLLVVLLLRLMPSGRRSRSSGRSCACA